MSNLQIKPGSSLDRKAKEIARLYGEICAAARISLCNAIKIGGILTDVHESPAFKGKWLKWLAECVPFSQPTAWRYMQYYKRREELFKLNNLSEANGLILALPEGQPCKPKSRNKAVGELVSKGIAKDERAAREILRKRKEEAKAVKEPEPEPKTESDSKPKLQTPKGWAPPVLEESDLIDEELRVVKHVHEYLASTPKGRCEAFLRYIREHLECGRE